MDGRNFPRLLPQFKLKTSSRTGGLKLSTSSPASRQARASRRTAPLRPSIHPPRSSGNPPIFGFRAARTRVDSNMLPLDPRSEEHTSELQSRQYLVCRLLLEKKYHINHVVLLRSRCNDCLFQSLVCSNL